MSVTWVRPKKMAELTGYTELSLMKKMNNGTWAQGRVWRKAPDGRRLINIKEYEKWVESRPVSW